MTITVEPTWPWDPTAIGRRVTSDGRVHAPYVVPTRGAPPVHVHAVDGVEIVWSQTYGNADTHEHEGFPDLPRGCIVTACGRHYSAARLLWPNQIPRDAVACRFCWPVATSTPPPELCRCFSDGTRPHRCSGPPES